MSAEAEPELALEIAHLLLIDIVGYSKLLADEQIECIQQLNHIVRGTESFSAAEKEGKLIRVPTGDGMALLFFRSPEEPVRCALEIADALKIRSQIRVRMGIHSGPINRVADVNDSINVAGAGINVAQRVMDCGDAGHILLSDHVADDLVNYGHWRPYLHDLGECEVKHGLRLKVFNLCKDGLGNSVPPEKLSRGKRWNRAARAAVRPVIAPPWPKMPFIIVILLAAGSLVFSLSIFLRRSAPLQLPGNSGASVNAVPATSIAVLPFENLSDDTQNAHFSDGVQDAILTDLANVADLKVISRTSVLLYRGTRQNVRDIGQQLGVTHVLEGTVQREGKRVRVTAQLIDARTDHHLWAERYDRDIADVFALESDLAQTIVGELKVKLAPEEKAAIEKSPSASVGAYELYVRARTALASSTYTRGRQSRLEAIEFLTQAIQLDPSFLLAHCLLARVHSEMYLVGLDHTPPRLVRAEEALENARRVRPDSGHYHLALATYVYGGHLNYDRARKELDIARRSLPNEPSVYELAGYIHRRQGRWEQSMRDLEHSVDLDPLNFDYLQQLAQSYAKIRDFPRLAATLDRALRIVPNDAGVRVRRAGVLLDWRAETKPLHETLEAILAENPALEASLADDRIDLALCERDFAIAEKALASLPTEGASVEGFVFPKAWFQAVIRRAKGDSAGANEAFTAARAEVEKIVREQPDYAEALCLLGLIDAGLGQKEDALREGEHAMALLPLEKDAINGALLSEYLAVIYAWVGEADSAFKQLAMTVKTPGDLSFGQLKLRPVWDPLRNDPRFDEIVASLAPK
jgi:TolB-like protein/class 3 adenylate cyclase/Tfp pilus assembly protein PilF